MRFRKAGILLVFFITLTLGYAQAAWLPKSNEKLQKTKKIVTKNIMELAEKDNYFDSSFVNTYVDGLMNSINQNNGQGAIIAHDARRWCKFTFTADNDENIRKVEVKRYQKDFGETFKECKIDQSEWLDLIKQFNKLGYAETKVSDGNIKYSCDFEKGSFLITTTRSHTKDINLLNKYSLEQKNEAPAIDTKSNIAYAQNINLLPKYGLAQKNEVHLAADKKYLAEMDELFNGNREKASETVAKRGWQFLRQGQRFSNEEDVKTAMKRFNQAWLLDNKNGTALWGMAAIRCNLGEMDSLQLFSEAEQYMSHDIDFAVDHARAIGIMAMKTINEMLLAEAFNRYEQLYKIAPQNILNLQNWAIILYYTGNYAEAWKKIKLAEAAPRGNELDKKFIADLQSKMPRPQ